MNERIYWAAVVLVVAAVWVAGCCPDCPGAVRGGCVTCPAGGCQVQPKATAPMPVLPGKEVTVEVRAAVVPQVAEHHQRRPHRRRAFRRWRWRR